MKTIKIHFIRHGLALGAAEGRYIGHTDVPLSEEGIRQLEEMRDGYGYPDAEAVLSSPLLRCTQTAKILYPDSHPAVIEDFIEYDFGEFENRTAEELADEPAFGEWLKGGQQAAPPYGESNEEFSLRVCNCFRMVVDGLMRSDTASCAIITHGGVLMTILSAFGIPELKMTEWVTPNGCGYTVSIIPSVWSQLQKFEVQREIPDVPHPAASPDAEEEYNDDIPIDETEFFGFYDPSQAGTEA